MQIFKADSAILQEDDFEELEKDLVYIDREGGFVALRDPETPDVLLIELKTSDADA